jgi:GNAT superfamily N-acetyltransferase
MTPLHALGIGELEAIARIWAAALRDGPAGADRPDVAALRQRLATDLHDCHAEVLRVDGEIVAFVLCNLDRRWLRQLFVDPPHQGSGLGTRLLDLARQAMPGGWLRTDAANARVASTRAADCACGASGRIRGMARRSSNSPGPARALVRSAARDRRRAVRRQADRRHPSAGAGSIRARFDLAHRVAAAVARRARPAARRPLARATAEHSRRPSLTSPRAPA